MTALYKAVEDLDYQAIIDNVGDNKPCMWSNVGVSYCGMLGCEAKHETYLIKDLLRMRDGMVQPTVAFKLMDQGIITPDCIPDNVILDIIQWTCGSEYDYSLIRKLFTYIPKSRWLAMRGSDGITALHALSYCGVVDDIFQEFWDTLLLLTGSELVNVKSDYETIIPSLVRDIRLLPLKQLAALGLMDINQLDYAAHSMLRTYAESKDPHIWQQVRDTFEFLVQHGLDWNLKDEEGNTITVTAHHFGWAVTVSAPPLISSPPSSSPPSSVTGELKYVYSKYSKNRNDNVNDFEIDNEYYSNAEWCDDGKPHYTKHDGIMYNLLITLKEYQHTRDLISVQNMIQLIIDTLTLMPADFLARSRQRLHNNTYMYGFLRLNSIHDMITV